MSYDIRLANGDVTVSDLLGTDDYLVSNFPRQVDMQPIDQWLAVQPNEPLLQTFEPSLEVGSGNYYGLFATAIEFTTLTEGQRRYIHTTIMGGKPVAKVTAYLEHPINGFGVYTGQLLTPYAANSQGFSRYDQRLYTINTYLFQRATAKTGGRLLLESGSHLLLESGDKIFLETS